MERMHTFELGKFSELFFPNVFLNLTTENVGHLLIYVQYFYHSTP